MRLLVGLGNPGAEHARQRHNIGFMAIDAIAQRHGLPAFKARFSAAVSEGRIGAEKVIALKPATYMNRSGDAVVQAARFYKVEPADIVVFHDELDLAPGKIRVKRGGGAAGHNGLRSMDAAVGPDYWRVRLGIGHPGHKDLVSGYVLHDFAKADRSWIEPLLDAVADELPRLVEGDPEGFMSRVALAVQPR